MRSIIDLEADDTEVELFRASFREDGRLLEDMDWAYKRVCTAHILDPDL